MLSFDDYKNTKSASTLGEVRKNNSDIIIIVSVPSNGFKNK